MSKVVIAAVNGFALGGGCELALACDFAYAADGARFGQPEVGLGVIPGFGGTTRLARRVGMARAIELVASGATLTADEALRIGLVNRVVPAAELLAAAHAIAETIARKAPRAVAAAKQSLRASAEMTLEKNNRLEMELFAACFQSEDQKEGMRAFMEKRPPGFQGR
jgi:enoyl-CoA hydratase